MVTVSPGWTIKSSPAHQVWSLARSLKLTGPMASVVLHTQVVPSWQTMETPWCQLSPGPSPRIVSELPKPTSIVATTLVTVGVTRLALGAFGTLGAEALLDLVVLVGVVASFADFTAGAAMAAALVVLPAAFDVAAGVVLLELDFFMAGMLLVG